MNKAQLKLVLIGGGTGSFTLLQELKHLTPDISAIVTMSDNGGSTGVLRDELGVLPPGDIRQCLVALSDSLEVRNLFNYRFGKGRFSGQSLGNIILSGLELEKGSFLDAVSIAGEILHITGKVIPVTLDKHMAVMHDGPQIIKGENRISEHRISSPKAYLELDPPSKVNPAAVEAIAQADVVVIAPGNIYGSLLPVLSVTGVVEALQNTKAAVISVTNLVNKPGQTDNWHVVDYVKKLEEYIGEHQIDAVLYNTQTISPYLLKRYAAQGEYPVAFAHDRFSEINATTKGAKLVSKDMFKQDPNDTAIQRTLIRHDAYAVSLNLQHILSVLRPELKIGHVAKNRGLNS